MAQKVENVEYAKLAQALVKRVETYCGNLDAQSYIDSRNASDIPPELKTAYDQTTESELKSLEFVQNAYAKALEMPSDVTDEDLKLVTDAHAILDRWQTPEVKITQRTHMFLRAAIGFCALTALALAYKAAIAQPILEESDLNQEPQTIVSPE